MKFITVSIAMLLMLYACFWIFNHINPWLAIVVGICCILASIYKLLPYLKK